MQPIFNVNTQVFAYEMLYSAKQLSQYSNKEDEISPQLLVDAIFTYGINKLSGEKPSLVKFTPNLIELEVPTLLNSEHIIVEIFEPLAPELNVLKKLKSLREKGYTIVFGEYVFQSKYSSFLEFANFIKVNFENVTQSLKEEIIHYSRTNISIIGDKIDSFEKFEKAKSLGCTYFQGDFFSKPQTLSVKEIPAIKFNLLELLSEVNEETPDFSKISDVISRDVSLSYKLLRLINSLAFGFRNKIESIKHAIVALGSIELRKWVSILTIDKLCQDKPDELVRTSLIRAKFAEQLSLNTNLKSRSSDLFITGLFSVLDVIMGRPLDEVLNDIQISLDIKDVLIHEKGIFEDIFAIVISYEKCDWKRIDSLIEKTGVNEEYIIKSYLDATGWCNEVLQESLVFIH